MSRQDAARLPAALARAGGSRMGGLLILLLGLAPVVILGVYAVSNAGTALSRQIARANQATAMIARDLVEREFARRLDALEVLASGPAVLAAARNRDAAAMRLRMRTLAEHVDGVDRAFVAAPDGVLWSDWPEAPESLGQNFADRDWYRGIKATGAPYVSQVYRRRAEPRPLVVALAVPIADPGDGADLGMLVYQMRLDELARLLPGALDQHMVYVVDPDGHLATDPAAVAGDQPLTDMSDAPPVVAALAGKGGEISYEDPASGQTLVASALPARVGGRDWVVVSAQPREVAGAPVQAMSARIALAGVLTLMVLGAMLAVLSAQHRRTRRMGARLDEMNRNLMSEIGERREAQEALRDLNAQLERHVAERTEALRESEEKLRQAQKLESLGRLAGGIAHDFNNILTVILGHCDLARRGGFPPDRVPAQFAMIHRAGQRAAQLVSQLLAFSRKQVLQPRVMQLNEVVADACEILERLIGEDIDMHLRLAEGLPPVTADPGQMQQVLMNLALNARDAMQGGGKLTIETRAVVLDAAYVARHPEASAGPHVMLAVTDTGQGMDEATRQRIFEPFFTTKALGQGTGLGLATVYGIVKQSGGNIWVYSEPDHGTSFKVYLPATTAPAEAGMAAAASGPARGGDETVLLVEDEPDVRAFLLEVLAGAGYRVLAAPDPATAMDLATGHDGPIPLLLTDVVLPGMNGRQLSERLSPLRPEMATLFMSGYTDNAVVHHGVLDPGTELLPKPVSPDDLLARVRALLDAKAAH